MVNSKTSSSSNSAPKKKRSSGGLRKKGPTAYNKFMSEELARLKEDNIEPHKERWSRAIKAWNAGKGKSSASGSSP
ncbi:hypothetical protein DFH09DRAFT_1127501 [Mycena vulgaris]|nr:hypothetical protein DFH09DRAFT_1127501 [Mycena vulgaris]